MSSIHDSFNLIKKIAAFRTSEDINSIEDDDIRQEVIEDDMQYIRDTLDRVIAEARALEAKHPYDYVDMSGAAIREHFEDWGQNDEVAGLTDEDLQEAGAWALDNPQLWEDIYAAWEYGIANVRSDKEKREQ